MDIRHITCAGCKYANPDYPDMCDNPSGCFEHDAWEALDTPATLEDARKLVQWIQSHGIKLGKNAHGQPVIMDVLTCPEDRGVALLTAYADNIRKECADRYCEHRCAWPPREWEHPDECECSDRAAIMRKEEP